MKNKINYLFFINTFIIWAITFALFLLFIIKYKNNITINKIIEQNYSSTIILVILEIIIVCLITGIYYFLFYSRIKKEEITFTKKFINHIYSCTGLLFINIMFCALFSSLTLNMNNELNILIFQSLSFTISSLFLFIIAWYSYFLNIGYNYTIDHKNNSVRKEE